VLFLCTGALRSRRSGPCLTVGSEQHIGLFIAGSANALSQDHGEEDQGILIVDGHVWTSQARRTAAIDLAPGNGREDWVLSGRRCTARLLVMHSAARGRAGPALRIVALSPRSDRIQKCQRLRRKEPSSEMLSWKLEEVENISPRQFSRALQKENGQSCQSRRETAQFESARLTD